MSNKIFALILIWTAVFAIWIWAAPSQNPPGGGGLIRWDSANSRIAITTTTIWIGAGTIIDMNNRVITKVRDPLAPDEAVNKRYVDNNYGGSNAQRLWGQGRPSLNVVNSGGECTNNNVTPNIKISRSDHDSHWDGAAAVCPRGWWVCTASQRDKNGATAGYGSCGSGTRDSIECDVGGSVGDELRGRGTDRAWVADGGANPKRGKFITVAGDEGSEDNCSVRPVWCCKN